MATEYQCDIKNNVTETGPGAVRKYINKSIQLSAVQKKSNKEIYRF